VGLQQQRARGEPGHGRPHAVRDRRDQQPVVEGLVAQPEQALPGGRGGGEGQGREAEQPEGAAGGHPAPGGARRAGPIRRPPSRPACWSRGRGRRPRSARPPAKSCRRWPHWTCRRRACPCR
ncbi:MAG: hypothetical protein ACK559_35270, partial [bacterium]